MASTRRSRDDVIEAARQAAAKAETTVLSRSDFVRLTGISDYHIYKLFPDGGWLEVLELAGLSRHPHSNAPVSDDALLAEFHRVASELGRIPAWHVLGSRGGFSPDTIRKRFGGLQGTLKRYRTWLEMNEPESPMLALLPGQVQRELPSSPAATFDSSAPIVRWSKGDTTQYGPPISFRGLRHAPINEQGVVYLFGMVSNELGFLVEAIHSSFPDCEAKRCVDQRNDRWQRVRIEFEYRSGNFRDHGHDPAGCDLIVCWRHDWPECALEVLELCQVVNRLSG